MTITDIFSSLDLQCDKFEHYFPLYEQWFSKFVNKSPKILEIGVQFGGSAEMWRKYFGPGTLVCGVDIAPRCKETEYLKLYVGDQGSEEFWDNTFLKNNISNFDIIIDDGSHNNPHQILTLKKTFNLLKDGGIYWCEDTHTSYYPNNIRDIDDGGLLNPKSFIEYTKKLVDVVNQKHTRSAVDIGNFDGPKLDSELLVLHKNMQGIHFYDSVVVIEKGTPVNFNRVIRK